MSKTKGLLCFDAQYKLDFAKPEEVTYITVNKFDDPAVNEFYKNFQILHSNPNILIIPIIINSYGGNVHALLAMLGIMASSSKPIATIGMGKAMSCGSILLAAGTKGYRYADGFTSIMIHEVSSLEIGKVTDLKYGVEETTRLNSTLMKLYVQYSDVKDPLFFTKRMSKNKNADWYLSANEYKKLGLIDYIGIPSFMKG